MTNLSKIAIFIEKLVYIDVEHEFWILYFTKKNPIPLLFISKPKKKNDFHMTHIVFPSTPLFKKKTLTKNYCIAISKCTDSSKKLVAVMDRRPSIV